MGCLMFHVPCLLFKFLIFCFNQPTSFSERVPNLAQCIVNLSTLAQWCGMLSMLPLANTVYYGCAWRMTFGSPTGKGLGCFSAMACGTLMLHSLKGHRQTTNEQFNSESCSTDGRASVSVSSFSRFRVFLFHACFCSMHVPSYSRFKFVSVRTLY